MDPREFHRLATELVDKSHPVHYRTAISRSYYAVFNFGAKTLRSMGFKIDESSKGHGEVRNKFSNCGDDELMEVGSQMGDLHGMRIKADYRMTDQSVERAATAKLLVEQATIILTRLEGCHIEPKRTQIIAAIKEYEQKIKHGT